MDKAAEIAREIRTPTQSQPPMSEPGKPVPLRPRPPMVEPTAPMVEPAPFVAPLLAPAAALAGLITFLFPSRIGSEEGYLDPVQPCPTKMQAAVDEAKAVVANKKREKEKIEREINLHEKLINENRNADYREGYHVDDSILYKNPSYLKNLAAKDKLDKEIKDIEVAQQEFEKAREAQKISHENSLARKNAVDEARSEMFERQHQIETQLDKDSWKDSNVDWKKYDKRAEVKQTHTNEISKFYEKTESERSIYLQKE